MKITSVAFVHFTIATARYEAGNDLLYNQLSTHHSLHSFLVVIDESVVHHLVAAAGRVVA